MATSKGQADAHGHSPAGNFGHGGHHKKDNIHATPPSGDYLKNMNMHQSNQNTAGAV